MSNRTCAVIIRCHRRHETAQQSRSLGKAIAIPCRTDRNMSASGTSSQIESDGGFGDVSSINCLLRRRDVSMFMSRGELPRRQDKLTEIRYDILAPVPQSGDTGPSSRNSGRVTNADADLRTPPPTSLS